MGTPKGIGMGSIPCSGCGPGPIAAAAAAWAAAVAESTAAWAAAMAAAWAALGAVPAAVLPLPVAPLLPPADGAALLAGGALDGPAVLSAAAAALDDVEAVGPAAAPAAAPAPVLADRDSIAAR